jgi:hypothetical protein
MNWLTSTEAVELVERDQSGWKWFKYVRVGDRFRFTDVDSMIQHKNMVSKDERSVVKSAGMIEIRTNMFRFQGYGSQSLRIEWSPEDTERLAKELGRPCVEEYDG